MKNSILRFAHTLDMCVLKINACATGRFTKKVGDRINENMVALRRRAIFPVMKIGRNL